MLLFEGFPKVVLKKAYTNQNEFLIYLKLVQLFTNYNITDMMAF